MTKTITIGDAKIPLDSYAIGGTALLGIRGSGKTWTAKGIAEQLLEHRVPIIVFDPIGVWRHLKVPAAKNGKGYPVVVAGGRGADLPLTPASATEIVRAAMRENIPLVVDLFDKTMSKSDWRRIVQTCFRTLLYENEGVRHIFLEEAAEYVPQRVQDGETYAEVEKLVRMGGNASLGITLINQRAQEVNKAVLDLCENLVLMRQIGAHAIDALEKWIDKVSPDFASEIASAMPKMRAGDAWVFAGGAEKPIFTRTGAIRTYHPDRKNPDAKVAAAATDTSAFVAAMQRALPAIVEQQKENDPKALKARIRELEHRPAAPNLVENTALRTALTEAQNRVAVLEADNRALEQHRDALAKDLHGAYDGMSAIRQRAESVLGRAVPEFQKPSVPVARTVTPAPARQPTAAPAPRTSRPSGNPPATRSGLKPSAVKMLRAFYWLKDEEATPAKVYFFAGYSESGYTDKILGTLRSGGFVKGWRITDAGVAELGGQVERKPTGSELREWLRGNLSAAQNKMLDVLIDAGGARLSDEEISERTGFSISGYFDKLIGKLRSIEAADGYAKDGGTRAAAVFFE